MEILPEIQTAKDQYEFQILELGAKAIGIGLLKDPEGNFTENIGIIVSVDDLSLSPQIQEILSISGIPFQVQFVGKILAQE